MPFTEQHRRRLALDNALAEQDKQPGDRCFLHYYRMVQAWRESPRWTTADGLLSGLIPDPEKRAEALAYLEFYRNHVSLYEDKKRAENGDI